MTTVKNRWSARWLVPVAIAGAVGLIACGGGTSESDGTDPGVEVESVDEGQPAETGPPNPWEAGNRAAAQALDTPPVEPPGDELAP